MKKNDNLFAQRLNSYCELFGRTPEFQAIQTDEQSPYVEVYRFGKQSSCCPLPDFNVYISSGMSDLEMIVPAHLNYVPKTVEITAYSTKITNTKAGMDFICWIIQWLCHYPFAEKTFLASGQTFNVGSPIIPGSEMTAYYFAETPIIDANRLFDASPNATGFIHLVPISEAERQVAVNKGVKALLTLFDTHKISPVFDLDRQSVV